MVRTNFGSDKDAHGAPATKRYSVMRKRHLSKFALTFALLLAGSAQLSFADEQLTWSDDSETRTAAASERPLAISPSGRNTRTAPQPSTRYHAAPPGADAAAPDDPTYVPPASEGDGTFSRSEIKETGHRFFGRVSMGLARVIEYAFSRAGRPNGYILGEDAGGAIVAGVRYGEGVLYTKDAGRHRVYWQGPSIGYDFGAEGSKTMILVYNLQDVSEIYSMFGGVGGSAYFIGGVGITFQKRDHVTLAPIRSGLGLRLGANVGYLKYTRRPTWNPF